MNQQAKVNKCDGPDTLIVEDGGGVRVKGGGTVVVNDGGTITLEGGGTLDLEDGGIIDFGTVTLTRSGNNLVFANLPTSDPGVEGALYADSNVLTISAGA